MKTLLSRRSFVKKSTLGGFFVEAFNYSLFKQVRKHEILAPVLIDSNGNSINSLLKWKKQRKMIRQRWLNYLGPLKPNPVPPQLEVINEGFHEGLTRQFVSYEGEPGITVRGYLIKPRKIQEPLPAIVAMHSTSDNEMLYLAGVKDGNIVDFGFQLAKLGFVVFCPQCFLWHDKGDRSYQQQVERFQVIHPNSKGMAKMMFDAQRAVDVLVSLEEVDSGRIGAMGHSLGAKEVFYLAAFDERVKAVVCNEGGIGIEFSNWDADWYLSKEIHGFGHQHHELLSLIAPRPFLLIGGDSADGKQSEPYIESVLPVYALYGEEEKKNIVLFNHGKGHSVSPEAEQKTYKWLIDFLHPGIKE